MLNKTKHFLTTLVVAGFSAVAFPANAATMLSGDILLGFRASGNTGATEIVYANLGDASALYAAATDPSQFTVSGISSLGATLTTVYGANWHTRSDLFWGIAGANTNSTLPGSNSGDPNRTSYLSKAQTTINPGFDNSTNPTVASSYATTLSNLLIAQRNTFNADSEAATSNVVTVATSVANTWEDQNSGTNSFGLGYSVEGNFGNGASGTALDLFRLLAPASGSSTGTFEGTLTIDNTGAVSFQLGLVPEPSRALLAGAGLFGIFFRRRRPAKA